MSLNSSLQYDHGVFDYHQNQFLSPDRFGRPYHENYMVSYLFSLDIFNLKLIHLFSGELNQQPLQSS